MLFGDAKEMLDRYRGVEGPDAQRAGIKRSSSRPTKRIDPALLVAVAPPPPA